MLTLRVATFAAAIAVTMAAMGSAPVLAQAGAPNVTPPVVNESTRTTTDAAKKAVEAERKRAEDEAKKKAATGK